MKTRILIIEDSFAKFFCMKNLLESQLKVPVGSMDAKDALELVAVVQSFRPSMMFVRPAGGVSTLLSMLKKRQVNRRNTEIKIVLTSDLEESWWNEMEGHAKKTSVGDERIIPSAASKAA